jgi:hypothetical protein
MCSSWHDKRLTHQRSDVEDQCETASSSSYNVNEEFQEDEDNGNYATWTWSTSVGGQQVTDPCRDSIAICYNKCLSDYISDKLFISASLTQHDDDTGSTAIFSADESSEEAAASNEDEDEDSEWEIVSVESVVSL